MAIDSSEVAIVNEALNILGLRTITDTELATPPTPRKATAAVANESYERHRDALLRAYPWNFTITRATLTVDGTAPDWGFLYRYAIPPGADPIKAMRILDINQENFYVWGVNGWYEQPHRDQWRVEQGFIHSHIEDDLEIKYIGFINDADEMDSLFIEALAAMLAYRWSKTLLGETNLQFKADYNDIMRDVQNIDAQEGVPDSIETSTWVSARW